MNTSSRRWIAGFIRFALVIAAMVLVGGWVVRRIPKPKHMRAQIEAPPPSSTELGRGDMRLYNADSALDVVLQGDKLLAGLSPKVIDKVRTEMDSSRGQDSGLGGAIASMVKKTVSNAIGTHIVYPVRDIRDLRYEDGWLVIEWKKGGEQKMFGNVNVDDHRENKTFREDESKRFIEAVRARMRELGPEAPVSR
jgi:hypothetical protein